MAIDHRAVLPLMLLCLSLITAVEAETIVRWVRRKMPSRPAATGRIVSR